MACNAMGGEAGRESDQRTHLSQCLDGLVTELVHLHHYQIIVGPLEAVQP